MSALSDYLEQALLNWYFRGIAHTPPATFYVALFTADPTDAGGGTEVDTQDWTNYARPAIDRDDVSFSEPTDDGSEGFEITNAALVNFGNAVTTAPVPLTHAALMDAPTGGNVLWHGSLENPKTINNTDPVYFPAGSMKFRMR